MTELDKEQIRLGRILWILDTILHVILGYVLGTAIRLLIFGR